MAINLALGDTRLIIDTCKAHELLRNQAAYVLATAYHETAHTMKPVREMGGEKYLRSKRYYPYVGMGYVQLTWLANYEKAGKKLGVDFVKDPRLLLKPEHAAPILVIGMKEGWFTGKKLSDYVTLKASDFKGARRIINGTDRAALIASHAITYDKLLKTEGYGETKPQAKEAVMAKTDTQKAGLFGDLAGAAIDKMLDRALDKVVKSPSIPVSQKEADAVKQVVKAEMVKEAVAVEQHQTNTEAHWWQKRSRISAIIGTAAPIIGTGLKLLGWDVEFGAAQQIALTDGLMAIGALWAAYLAYRAGVATKPLGA